MPLVANSSGKIVGSFTIPANVKVGTRLFTALGSGGTRGSASFTAQGIVNHRVIQKVTVTNWFDPLAQTFVLSEGRMISGVSINFCTKGSSTARKPVIVQIRNVENGWPTSEVLAESVIEYDDIVIGQPYNSNWTMAEFTPPATLQGSKEYCIVLLTDDKDHAVAIASLGKYVSAGNGKEGWVTEQAYQIGVLMSSSNASTWTPHQTEDLAFKLHACKFTSNTRTVDLGVIQAVNASDFRPAFTVFRPSAEADALFGFTPLSSGDERRGYEDRNIELPSRVTDTVSVKAYLAGSEHWSPVLYPDGQVLVGDVGTLDNYIGRGIQAATLFNATLRIEVLKSGGSNIVPKLEVARTVAGVDQYDGDGVALTNWVSMNLTGSAPVGDGWVEETYNLAGLRGVGLQRLTSLYFDVSGTTGSRPYGRKARLVLK